MDRSNQFKPQNDEYMETALQIFDYCGVDSSDTLSIDVLMDKIAPSEKANKSEYTDLRTMLDPEERNPKINVTELAKALNEYSETQTVKMDLEESFNLRNGSILQDSDSGISNDGFQLLEELQSELREKTQLAFQLRSQLDYSDQQHEELLSTVTAERDSLRVHVNMLCEENAQLSGVRRDYEEASARLVAEVAAAATARRDLEAARRRARTLGDAVDAGLAEKQTLQDMLSISKEECHRINEMYASRQSTLLEENETLKRDYSDLSRRFQDQEEFLQQMIKEKVLLEMELKDILNKSNDTRLHLDRSIDVSYCDDHMLTELNSLSPDSRFGQQQLLSEDLFLKDLQEQDQSRLTNMSLFDEIRLSISSRNNVLNNIKYDQCEMVNAESKLSKETQTLALMAEGCIESVCINDTISSFDHCEIANAKFKLSKETQTLPLMAEGCIGSVCINDTISSFDHCEIANAKSKLYKETQTLALMAEGCIESVYINDTISSFDHCANKFKPCSECVKLNAYIDSLEKELQLGNLTKTAMKSNLKRFEDNLARLESYVEEEKSRNRQLQSVIGGLNVKLVDLETALEKQKGLLNSLNCDKCCAESQTECVYATVATQADASCGKCEKLDNAARQPKKSRGFIWDTTRSLFQIFAVVCFCLAAAALYRVTQYQQGAGRCRPARRVTPWRWLGLHDLLDLLLRVEYVGEVPM